LLLPGLIYDLAVAAQIAFYGLIPFALVGVRVSRLRRVANVALTFVVLNAAAVLALRNFLMGKDEVWVR
jgi:hypothetical protein